MKLPAAVLIPLFVSRLSTRNRGPSVKSSFEANSIRTSSFVCPTDDQLSVGVKSAVKLCSLTTSQTPCPSSGDCTVTRLPGPVPSPHWYDMTSFGRYVWAESAPPPNLIHSLACPWPINMNAKPSVHWVPEIWYPPNELAFRRYSWTAYVTSKSKVGPDLFARWTSIASDKAAS